MTCIVRYPTKKAFREADHTKVTLEDPSIVAPFYGRMDNYPKGRFVVTNHPKRSWFATVERLTSGAYRIR